MNESYDLDARADGWTPILDCVVRELGTTAALVYGVVYRHCKMKHGVCYASQLTLAELTGLSDRTIRRWLPRLCENGYLRDLTPKAQGVAHTYALTGKAVIVVKATVESLSQVPYPDDPGHSVQGTPDRVSDVPRTECPATPDGVSDEEIRGEKSGDQERRSSIDDLDDDDCRLILQLQEFSFSEKEAIDIFRICGSANNTREWIEHVRDPENGIGSPGAYLRTSILKNKTQRPPEPKKKTRQSTETREERERQKRHNLNPSCPKCHRVFPAESLCPVCGKCSVHCDCKCGDEYDDEDDIVLEDQQPVVAVPEVA